MYEAFREAPQSQKDRSRLKLGLWITLAAVLLALTATPLVWASRQSAAYRRYMDALNGSVLCMPGNMTACGWSGPAAASTILSWPGPVSAKSSGRPEWESASRSCRRERV